MGGNISTRQCLCGDASIYHSSLCVCVCEREREREREREEGASPTLGSHLTQLSPVTPRIACLRHVQHQPQPE